MRLLILASALVVAGTVGCHQSATARPQSPYWRADVVETSYWHEVVTQKICADVGQWWHGDGEHWQVTLWPSKQQTWTPDKQDAVAIAEKNCPTSGGSK